MKGARHAEECLTAAMREAGIEPPPEVIADSRAYSIRTYIKAAIVRLALWGVLPVAVAEWLIQRGRLRHV